MPFTVNKIVFHLTRFEFIRFKFMLCLSICLYGRQDFQFDQIRKSNYQVQNKTHKITR